MKNKIEEQILQLIDEINTLLESAPKGKGWEKTVKSMKKHSKIDNPFALAHWMKKKGYKPTKEADEFPNGSLSIIGSSKKPKNKKRKSKNEALDADSSGHITPDELKKQLDVSKAQLAAAKPGSKLSQSLPDKIKGQEDKLSKLQAKSFTSEPMK